MPICRCAPRAPRRIHERACCQARQLVRRPAGARAAHGPRRRSGSCDSAARGRNALPALGGVGRREACRLPARGFGVDARERRGGASGKRHALQGYRRAPRGARGPGRAGSRPRQRVERDSAERQRGSGAARGGSLRYVGYLACYARSALRSVDRCDHHRSGRPPGNSQCQHHLRRAAPRREHRRRLHRRALCGPPSR